MPAFDAVDRRRLCDELLLLTARTIEFASTFEVKGLPLRRDCLSVLFICKIQAYLGKDPLRLVALKIYLIHSLLLRLVSMSHSSRYCYKLFKTLACSCTVVTSWARVTLLYWSPR